MKRLSALDAAFLHIESAETPMHVGALHLLALPQGGRGGTFVSALRKHLAERLPLTPALRKRLWLMPMNITNPVWVDAEPDLAWHVVRHRLPSARTKQRDDMAALETVVGQLHGQLLDRRRPLWRFHVIEGLAPGPGGERRVALYTQLHHAAVDGQAAVALARAILDAQAQPPARAVRASTRPKRFRLSLVEMLSGAVAGEARQVAQLLRSLPEAAGSLGSAAAALLRRSALVTGRPRRGALGLAPRMALNEPVSAARAFAAVTLPLAELKALGQRHAATLNDVVLWLVGTALRAHFQAKGELPRKSMVAAVPVSLRAAGDAAAGNQASMTLVALGTQVRDDRARLAHVIAATRAMKRSLEQVRHVLPTDLPSVGWSWLASAAAGVYRRAGTKLPPVANLVVSNVPGPSMPLYLAGARMLTNYPCSIVTHGIGLNVTVQSYDQSLDVGLMADAKAMPDVRALAGALQQALQVLRALPLTDDAPGPRRTPTGKTPARKAVARKRKPGRGRGAA
jgi:WS/DGAT/MGAT family acyltransferase